MDNQHTTSQSSTVQEEISEPLIKTESTSIVAGSGFIGSIHVFFHECKRVLRVTRKPTGEEFKVIVKVSGVGILLIGAVGFIIHLFKQLLF